MLSPDEIIRSCLTENWRYRLAIQVQISRINTANEAVRAERERIEKDKRELLFGPSTDEETFRDPRPDARDTLRRVLIRDQADRDAISSQLMRYRDGRGNHWADIIDLLTMHPGRAAARLANPR